MQDTELLLVCRQFVKSITSQGFYPDKNMVGLYWKSKHRLYINCNNKIQLPSNLTFLGKTDITLLMYNKLVSPLPVASAGHHFGRTISRGRQQISFGTSRNTDRRSTRDCCFQIILHQSHDVVHRSTWNSC